MKPVTGVTLIHRSCNEFFLDYMYGGSGIEPGYDEARIDLIKEYLLDHEEMEDREECRSEAEEHADRELEDWESDSYMLLGDWKRVNENEGDLAYPEYDVDKEGTHGWAAILRRTDGMILQVVWSKWVMECAWCSPCYPGQGDLDTYGSVIAYSLPEDEYTDEFMRIGGRQVLSAEPFERAA